MFKARSLLDGSIRNIEEVFDPLLPQMEGWDRDWKEHVEFLNRDRGETAHWNWGVKAHHYHHINDQVLTYALTSGGRCHGLMIAHWPMSCALEEGAESLCIAYLEVAPWNRKDVMGAEREFAEIGPMLIYAAVRFSAVLDFNGRLTLSALPSAERFYRRIGMQECGVDNEKLKRFEFTDETAQIFLDAHGRLG